MDVATGVCLDYGYAGDAVAGDLYSGVAEYLAAITVSGAGVYL